jgi:hypothetical protein
MGDGIFSEDGVVEMREIVYMGEEAISILLQVMSGYIHWLARRTRMDVDECMWEVGV